MDKHLRFLVILMLLLISASPLDRQQAASAAAQTPAPPLKSTLPAAPWEPADPVPEATAGYGFAQCLEERNIFYVVGGGPANYNSDKLWKFDAIAGKWSQLRSMPAGLLGPAAVCYQGHLYVVGGYNAGVHYKTLNIYDIAKDAWSQGSSLSSGIYFAALGAWDGKLYLVGGTASYDPWPPLDHVNIYDIAAGSWSEQAGAPMPLPAMGAGYAQTGPYLWLVGGLSENAGYINLDTTQRYDMSADAWTVAHDFTSQRAFYALAATESHLYAIGGDVTGVWVSEFTTLVETLDFTAWPGSAWQALGDAPLPQPTGYNMAGFCTEVTAPGEIWSVGGVTGTSPNLVFLDANLYHPVAETCLHANYTVALTPASSSGSGLPGTVVTYTLQITNTGESPDAFDISAQFAWPVTLNWTPGAFAVGETRLVTATVQVPAGALAGEEDTATITVTSQGDASQIASAALVTTALAQRALSLAPQNQALAGNPGAVVAYTLQLTNTGNITDAYQLSVTGNAWEVQLPTSQLTLGVHAGEAVLVNVAIPAQALGLQTDTATLTAVSQGDPSVTASAALTTSATAIFNLSLAAGVEQLSGLPGEAITYTLQLTNTGNITDVFNLSCAGAEWLVGLPVPSITLARGASAAVAVVVHIPPFASPGQWDAITCTAASQGDPEVRRSVELTTRFSGSQVFLPVLKR